MDNFASLFSSSILSVNNLSLKILLNLFSSGKGYSKAIFFMSVVRLNPLPLIARIRTRFSAFYRLASRLNYKLKNLRLELFRTFLISSFQWRTLYWPQMSFSTSFILKKKVISQVNVRIRTLVNISNLYVGNPMIICVWILLKI